MWSDKKPWWVKKSVERSEEKTHYKNWCVIKVAVETKYDANKWSPVVTYKHKALVKSNAPEYYDPNTGKLKKVTVLDNLTQAEAIACAKGLDFFEEE